MDMLLSILGALAVLAGPAGVVFGKAVFYTKAVKQAVEVFEELNETNSEIYNKIKNDPSKKEITKVISGGIKKINGLTGLEL